MSLWILGARSESAVVLSHPHCPFVGVAAWCWSHSGQKQERTLEMKSARSAQASEMTRLLSDNPTKGVNKVPLKGQSLHRHRRASWALRCPCEGEEGTLASIFSSRHSQVGTGPDDSGWFVFTGTSGLMAATWWMWVTRHRKWWTEAVGGWMAPGRIPDARHWIRFLPFVLFLSKSFLLHMKTASCIC